MGTIYNPTWGMGTFAYGINDSGEIEGWYVNDNEVHHIFVRAPNGTFRTFEYPGAGTGFCQGNLGFGINLEGAIVGHYIDSDNVFHGLLLTPDGKYTPFDAPEAGSAPSTCGGQGTTSAWINAAGMIVGGYTDANWVTHGYVRTPDGRIETFDPTGSLYTGMNYGSSSINQWGVVAGYYADADWVIHGYLRGPDGRITPFDVPGACSSGDACAFEGTWPSSINANGTIVGYFQDTGGVTHGFVRTPNGTCTTIDVPDTVVGGVLGTYPNDNNMAGAITGNYADANWVFHGFLRTPDGRFTTFDAPEACSSGAACADKGTAPITINSWGAITGYTQDAAGFVHGFLWTP